MQTRFIDPITDPIWMALLARYHSSVFHSPLWLQVLVDTYDLVTGAFVVINADGEPLAGLPICRVNDMRGERVVSLPFCDYCDPLVETVEQWEALTVKLTEEHSIVNMRCLNADLPLTDHRFSEVKQAKWHRLDLRPPLDAIWNGIDPAARRAILKAEHMGVEISPATSLADVRQFFELHLRIRKYKYHMIAQPYRFFENIWRRFIEPGLGVLLMARHNGAVIGTTLFLQWGDTLFYKFNASHMEHLAERPNDLLVWTAVRWAREHGLSWLDFGLSDWDQEGLIHFKRKFGTEERTIHFLRYANGCSESPGARTAGSMLSELTSLFTDKETPDALTEKAGDVLYRYFA